MTEEYRVVFVAWQSPRSRAIYPVARLLERPNSPRFEFAYLEGVNAASEDGFIPFARMATLYAVVRTDNLPPLFGNRLMQSSRPDYDEYLGRIGLEPGAAPMLVLAHSGARKTTDNIELFAPPIQDTENRWMYRAFVRGIRHVAVAEQHIANLALDERLLVEPDRGNSWDCRALRLLDSNQNQVGWVPQTLLDDLDRLRQLGSSIDVSVAGLNQAPAPVHQRLLVDIHADDQPGFSPFSTERYHPLSRDALEITVRSPHPTT